MLKYILKPRNIILLIAAAAMVVIIAGQGNILHSVITDYQNAKLAADEIAKKQDALDDRKDAAGTVIDDEEAARDGGYVSDDEIVFIYGK